MYKLFTLTICLFFLSSCSATKVYKGTVLTIQNGKDGYTALLENRKREKFEAVLSIPKMEDAFRILKIGEKVKLQGDTIHFNDKMRILVSKIH